MKISAAAALLGLALSTSETLASRTIQRKSDAVEEDRALWDRILQDAGMSLPPTGETSLRRNGIPFYPCPIGHASCDAWLSSGMFLW